MAGLWLSQRPQSDRLQHRNRRPTADLVPHDARGLHCFLHGRLYGSLHGPEDVFVGCLRGHLRVDGYHAIYDEHRRAIRWKTSDRPGKWSSDDAFTALYPGRPSQL